MLKLATIFFGNSSTCVEQVSGGGFKDIIEADVDNVIYLIANSTKHLYRG